MDGSLPTFVAIDFETADHYPDSACAIGLARVENGEIVSRRRELIRPPRSAFVFTYIHGITWPMVADAPTFGTVWNRVQGILDGADFLVAHNASFDRRVLSACCQMAELDPPALPFRCTVQAARKAWNVFPTKLPDVCRHLGITLCHHDAQSDADACARIMLAALIAERARLALKSPLPSGLSRARAR